MLPLALAALVALGPPASPAPDDPAVARARAAIASFKKSLLQALTGALQDSPAKAIEVCATQAPALAAAASKDGVVVGRSSPKLRNPDNAARPWVAEAMRSFAAEKPGAQVHHRAALPGGRTGYAEPLWTAPLCLTCHGPAVAAPVQAALRARYPKDAATGHLEGELRGVVWAEVAPKRP